MSQQFKILDWLAVTETESQKIWTDFCFVLPPHSGEKSKYSDSVLPEMTTWMALAGFGSSDRGSSSVRCYVVLGVQWYDLPPQYSLNSRTSGSITNLQERYWRSSGRLRIHFATRIAKIWSGKICFWLGKLWLEWNLAALVSDIITNFDPERAFKQSLQQLINHSD